MYKWRKYVPHIQLLILMWPLRIQLLLVYPMAVWSIYCRIDIKLIRFNSAWKAWLSINLIQIKRCYFKSRGFLLSFDKIRLDNWYIWIHEILILHHQIAFDLFKSLYLILSVIYINWIICHNLLTVDLQVFFFFIIFRLIKPLIFFFFHFL